MQEQQLTVEDANAHAEAKRSRRSLLARAPLGVKLALAAGVSLLLWALVAMAYGAIISAL